MLDSHVFSYMYKLVSIYNRMVAMGNKMNYAMDILDLTKVQIVGLSFLTWL